MKNITSGFLSRFLIIILGIVVRTVFIKTLGNDYLGINGLYSNILNVLSLAEMGFGTAMVYSMYKPLAEHNDSKLASLMSLYRRVYSVIGTVVLLLGLAVIPFMGYIIKDPPQIPYLTLYYVMFLLNTVLSYWFFAYKRSILIADQREYICTKYRMIFNLLKSAFQIVLLVIFHSFTVYLVTQMAATICENIVVAKIADKKYPSLTNRNPDPLEKGELDTIKHDVKGLMLSRIAHVILNSTDNIIISAFVGVSWVGLLSNYTLIIDSVTGVLCQITSALSPSLGNYFVAESKEEGYKLFQRVEFMNSWLYGFCAICLLTLLNPFISLWIGQEYLLSSAVIAALAINFFVAGYMNTLWTFRSTLGLFTQGWFRPLIVAGLNIVFSIALGIKLGTFGVLIATFISRAMVNIWYDPIIIHKYGFQKSALHFFKEYAVRVLQMIVIAVIIAFIKRGLIYHAVTVVSFAVLMVITLCVFIAMFWIFTRRSDEYKYFVDLVSQRFLKKLLRKNASSKE